MFCNIGKIFRESLKTVPDFFMFTTAQSNGFSTLNFRTQAQLNQWIRNYLKYKRKSGPVFFLDSQLENHPQSLKGYIASGPEYWIAASGGDVTTGEGPFPKDLFFPPHALRKKGTDPANASLNDCRSNVWEQLKAFRDKHGGWLFGWMGYDLKNETESLDSNNPDPVGLPDLFFFVPRELLAIDRRVKTIIPVKSNKMDTTPWYLFPVSKEDEPSFLEKRKEEKKNKYHLGAPVSQEGWENYRDKVCRVKEYISKGDTYEVNLTHQLRSSFAGDSLDLFEEMRRLGPVPFGAWFHFGEVDVCCASPERFLERKGDTIRSQPVKGTSRRGKHPEEDKEIIKNILQQEKNLAENVMIVDLVRNDLGRTAKKGSVRVESLLEVQSYSTLHQLVSTISAKVKPEISSVDLIKSCFPMGSMTGAPKIRTMEIIEALECYRRGLYSGAIGYFTPDDDFDFNVVIRTAIIKNGVLYYSVGGAITSGSDPREEWEETWLKSRALYVKKEKPIEELD